MSRRFATLVLGILLAAAPAAAQQPPPGAGMPRRAAMEEQVIQRFLENAAAAIELTADQQTRIGAILRASAERHRARALEGQRLRRELAAAVDDAQTTDAALVQLLDRMERLRAQEHEAWRTDQRAIAEILAPRQRAQFMLRWMAFQDTVREMIGRRAGRRGGGPPR